MIVDTKVKKLAVIFVLAWLANLVWENLHHVLYLHYQGQPITGLILFRASLFDAAVITILALPFILVPFFRARLWLAFVIGVVLAVGLEWWALATSRWAYTDLMPLIPLLGTGLTPTIQLGLIAYLVYKKTI